jgi:hypothetical protein
MQAKPRSNTGTLKLKLKAKEAGGRAALMARVRADDRGEHLGVCKRRARRMHSTPENRSCVLPPARARGDDVVVACAFGLLANNAPESHRSSSRRATAAS